MATFEVTIDTADAKTLRVLVAAEHWVEAWQEGLVLLGDDPNPPDASCVLDELTAHIEVPSSGRTFVVRPLPRPSSPLPTPERGRPLVLAGDAQTPAITVRQKRPGPPPEALAEPTRAGPVLADTKATRRPKPLAEEPAPLVDPVARVLSDLERQRLNARPVRIDSHGLPQRIDDGPNKRRATPQAVPRAGTAVSGLRPSERRTREETLAFTPAVSSPIDNTLPQLFRPVIGAEAVEEEDVPTARIAALQWAVDTAWHHVPCALAVLLDGLDTDDPEVVFARGERERETRGCRVPLTHVFWRAACRAPTRVRFAEAVRVEFVTADALTRYELGVASALCAPIAFVPGHPSPATEGLALVLLNSTRASGFIDSELRALTYLARTLASRLDGL